MNKTLNNINDAPTLGTSPVALVGTDINIYFYSGRWLELLQRHIEASRILPSSQRLRDLPENAMIVKPVLGGYRNYNYMRACRAASFSSVSPLMGEHFPMGYQIFFTGESYKAPWGGYVVTPRHLACLLSFETKHEQEFYNQDKNTHPTNKGRGDQLYWGKCVKCFRDSTQSIFTEDDADNTMVPRIESGRISYDSVSTPTLQDIWAFQLGIKYFLKLCQTTLCLQYDTATTMWLEDSFI